MPERDSEPPAGGSVAKQIAWSRSVLIRHRSVCKHDVCAIDTELERLIDALSTTPPLTLPNGREESCEHCSATLLPRQREPLLCIDCVPRCNSDCDHLYEEQPPVRTLTQERLAEAFAAKRARGLPIDLLIQELGDEGAAESLYDELIK